MREIFVALVTRAIKVYEWKVRKSETTKTSSPAFLLLTRSNEFLAEFEEIVSRTKLGIAKK